MTGLHAGELESVKRGVHVVTLACGVVCFSYNLLAWLVRRERHLAINAVIYGGLTALEIAQVRHHSR